MEKKRIRVELSNFEKNEKIFNFFVKRYLTIPSEFGKNYIVKWKRFFSRSPGALRKIKYTRLRLYLSSMLSCWSSCSRWSSCSYTSQLSWAPISFCFFLPHYHKAWWWGVFTLLTRAEFGKSQSDSARPLFGPTSGHLRIFWHISCIIISDPCCCFLSRFKI